jgi:cell division control protein 45
MYLPRDLISHLYSQLRQSWHATSPPVLLLVSLEPDALCACRILTALLKRDYISHNIIPVSGYGDLARVGQDQIAPMRLQDGGTGGTVICLGTGGLVDLGAVLGLENGEETEDVTGGIEFWVIDARRPWNLGNVFGGQPPEVVLGELDGNARTRAPDVSYGQIQRNYRSGKGGIIVFDDGDISEQLEKQREAYFKLEQMPAIEDDGAESDDSESETEDETPANNARTGDKRKSWSDADEDEDSESEERPQQRRRSNSVSIIGRRCENHC